MDAIYSSGMIVILSLLLTATISCARQQNDAAESAPVTENSQGPADIETVESYWTKERMDEAVPVPVPITPTPPSVVYPPGASEAPQSSNGH